MKLILNLLLTQALLISCSQSPNTIKELKSELEAANNKIKELEAQPDKEGIWYVFELTKEHNIVRLNDSDGEVIETKEMRDSVDTQYVFNHTARISQIKDDQLGSFFAQFREQAEVTHQPKGFGPNVENTSYHVKVFVVCEEDPLPIETENCTDNIYILVQPTELGYESNLFRLSRLFESKIKSLKDSDEGVVLELEHSRFPRKVQQILIRAELIKFK